MSAGAVVTLFKETFQDWSEDKASRLAAALAYYTVFSLAPLLLIVIAIAGLVFGAEAARGQVVGEIGGLIGTDSASAIEEMIENARRPESGVLATIIGIVTLLLGASGVFGQLQDALNTIWEVQPKPGQGILGMIRKRFFSFTMVLGTGFLLLVALMVSAMLSGVGKFLGGVLPLPEIVLQILNFVIGFAVVTVIFALIFKIVPDADIEWHDVWIGAAITALLFTIGRFAIGLYLGRSSTASTYGAAGSLIVILLWVYYSAQILFLGAEFTQVYARRYGSRIRPDEDAEAVTEEARAQQGMARKDDAGTSGQRRTDNAPARGEQAAYQALAPRAALSASEQDAALLADRSLGTLFRALIHDAQTLLRQELTLARTEIANQAAQGAKGAGTATGGGVLAYAGLLVLVATLTWAVGRLLPLGAAALVVGVAIVGVGLVLVQRARA